MTTATKKIEPGYKQTEVGVIPEDWEVKEIADVSTLKSGLSITSKKIFEMGLYPCYGGNGLRGFANDYTHEGDYALIGRQGALCGNVQFATGQFFASEHAVVVTPSPNTDIKWLSYVLDSMKLNQYSESSAQPGLSVYKIKILDIAYPPTKSEQTAIATALNDMDALIAAQEQLIAKKRAIKQGAMQELLEAKEGWEEKTMKTIGKTYGGLSGKSIGDFYDGGSLYIPFMNVFANPVIKTDYFDYVKIKQGESQNKALKGDLFFNTSSETPEEVGMCSVLNDDVQDLYLNSFCFGFRIHSEVMVDGLYLSYYFRSSYGREKMFLLAQGATRYNLSKGNFLKLELQLPSYEEQTRIAQILSDMDAEIEQLGVELAKLRGVKKGMMEELLTGAKRLNH